MNNVQARFLFALALAAILALAVSLRGTSHANLGVDTVDGASAVPVAGEPDVPHLHAPEFKLHSFLPGVFK
jgi:hypothetical protein